MTDHTGLTDRSAPSPAPAPTPPDYDLPETLELSQPAQYRALFEETRSEIVSLLLERAATTSELAATLHKPKGTIGHHLKVLEGAGLVRVVRTVPVRAVEAKYYGRTARVFLYHLVNEAAGEPQRIISRAASEIATVPVGPSGQDGPDDGTRATTPVNVNMRYARIPRDRAEEWAARLNDLITEFARQPAAGDVTYALVVGLYPTRRPALPKGGPDGTDPARAERDDTGPVTP